MSRFKGQIDSAYSLVTILFALFLVSADRREIYVINPPSY